MYYPFANRPGPSCRQAPSSALRAFRRGLWLCGLCLLLGFGLECGPPQGPTVVVNLGDAPGGLRLLRVTATLDGQIVRPTEDLAPTVKQVAYVLAAGASGTFEVYVRGVAADGCSPAGGYAKEPIASGSAGRVAVELGLEERSPPLCPVDVETTGSGTVIVNPTNMTCGERCLLDIAAGTSITLSANPSSRTNFAGWAGVCSGVAPCTVVVNRPVSVRAAFFPQLCTANGVCWESPLPASITLNGIWGSSANALWAVGDNGHILRYDGTAWSLQSSPTTSHLRAVWGSSASDVWAVGDSSTILHYDGSAWTAPTTGLPPQALTGVAGTGPTNVLAVGKGGIVFQYNGATWSNIPSGLTAVDFSGIYVSGTQILISSPNGEIYRKSGGSFTSIGRSSTGALNGISGSDDNNVLSVGVQGSLVRWDGLALTSKPGYPGGDQLLAVHTRATDDAWAVGSNGLFVHWNGKSTARLNAPTSQTLQAVFALAADNVWAVGQSGAILHWDGTGVMAYGAGGPPSVSDLAAVSGTGANDLWAVGANNTILHNTGQGWVPVPSGQPASVSFSEVYAASPSEVWVIGSNGGTPLILRWNGINFTSLTSPILFTLNAISGSSPTNIWIAGNNGALIRWNGTSLSPVSYAPSGYSGTPQFQAVAAVNPSEVWFGCNPITDGTNGATVTCILRYDGNNMQLVRPVIGSPNLFINGAAAVASNDVWFAGTLFTTQTHGVAVHVQNGVLNLMDLGTQYPGLNSVAVLSATDIWLAGNGGTVWHSTDGMGFTIVPNIPLMVNPFMNLSLYGIAPAGGGAVVTVGTKQTILRISQ